MDNNLNNYQLNFQLNNCNHNKLQFKIIVNNKYKFNNSHKYNKMDFYHKFNNNQFKRFKVVVKYKNNKY